MENKLQKNSGQIFTNDDVFIGYVTGSDPQMEIGLWEYNNEKQLINTNEYIKDIPIPDMWVGTLHYDETAKENEDKYFVMCNISQNLSVANNNMNLCKMLADIKPSTTNNDPNHLKGLYLRSDANNIHAIFNGGHIETGNTDLYIAPTTLEYMSNSEKIQTLSNKNLNIIYNTNVYGGLCAETTKITTSQDNKSNVLIGFNDPGNVSSSNSWSNDFPNSIDNITNKGGYPLVVRAYDKTGSNLSKSALVFGPSDIYALTEDNGKTISNTLCLQHRINYFGNVSIGNNLSIGYSGNNNQDSGKITLINNNTDSIIESIKYEGNPLKLVANVLSLNPNGGLVKIGSDGLKITGSLDVSKNTSTDETTTYTLSVNSNGTTVTGTTTLNDNLILNSKSSDGSYYSNKIIFQRNTLYDGWNDWYMYGNDSGQLEIGCMQSNKEISLITSTYSNDTNKSINFNGTVKSDRYYNLSGDSMISICDDPNTWTCSPDPGTIIVGHTNNDTLLRCNKNVIFGNESNNDNIKIDLSMDGVDSIDDIMNHLKSNYWGTITLPNIVTQSYPEYSQTIDMNNGNDDIWGSEKNNTKTYTNTKNFVNSSAFTSKSKNATINIPKMTYNMSLDFKNNDSAGSSTLTTKITVKNVIYYLTKEGSETKISQKTISINETNSSTASRGISNTTTVEFDVTETNLNPNNLDEDTKYYLNMSIEYEISIKRSSTSVYWTSYQIGGLKFKIPSRILKFQQTYEKSIGDKQYTIITKYGIISGSNINNAWGLLTLSDGIPALYCFYNDEGEIAHKSKSVNSIVSTIWP